MFLVLCISCIIKSIIAGRNVAIIGLVLRYVLVRYGLVLSNVLWCLI